MWFPIETLSVVREPVVLQGGGREFLGVLAGYDRQKRPVWKVLGEDGALRRLPRAALPSLWQPVDPAAWPAPLPIGVREAAPRPLFGDAASPPEPAADDWPFFGLRLGAAGAPPASPLELEARVLRALRTSRAPGVVKAARLGYGSGWPETLTEWSDKVAQWQGADRALLPTRSAWRPDRRDLDDWWSALIWLARLREPRQRPFEPNRFQKIFILRSLDPVWSFAAIADLKMGRDPQTIRRWYDEAVERMWALKPWEALA